MSKVLHDMQHIVTEVRTLIEQSKQQIAVSVNATMSLLYWHIGTKINEALPKGKRADYGKQMSLHCGDNWNLNMEHYFPKKTCEG